MTAIEIPSMITSSNAMLPETSPHPLPPHRHVASVLSSHVLFADASSHIPPQLGRCADSAKSQLLGKTSPEVDICKTKWWIYCSLVNYSKLI